MISYSKTGKHVLKTSGEKKPWHFTAKSASMYWKLLEENSHDILQQNRQACIENKWGKIAMTFYSKTGKHVLRTNGEKQPWHFTAKSASMYWKLLEENIHDILQQNQQACIEN